MKSSTGCDDWIAYHRAKPGRRLRLLCFPYAGGGASIFSGWASQLPPTVEVVPIQLPGRESRINDEPFLRFDPLVDALIEAIGHFLSEPVAFFGHSMGAVIAYETVRRLVSDGWTAPLRLIVSGCRAPHLPARRPPAHRLPDEEFMTVLRDLGGTSKEVLEEPELMELLLPLLRADFELIETYESRNGELLECPVIAYGGHSDREVDRGELEAWGQVTRGSFGVRMFSGGHLFLQTVTDRVVSALAEDLSEGEPR